MITMVAIAYFMSLDIFILDGFHIFHIKSRRFLF